MTVHTRTLIATVAGMLTVLVAASSPAPRTEGAIRITGFPDPTNAVHINSSAPYVVPTGQLLVLQAVSSFSSGQGALVRVDGVIVGGRNLPGIEQFPPPGFVASENSTVTLTSPESSCWGYLLPRTAPASERRIIGVPDPRRFQLVQQGESYVVPSGMSYVVTALGVVNSETAMLFADGVEMARDSNVGFMPEELPGPGIVLAPGTTVTVSGADPTNPNDGRAWGYLMRQAP